MKTGNKKFIIASIILSFFFTLICGEIIARVFGVTNVYEYDPELGWSPKKNFSARIKVVDQPGEKYLVEYSTNESGFRSFGDVHSRTTRILFVGDSWTGDPNTSDAEAYFGIVKDKLPVEVFAIGGGGYGTLQELLLVKKFAEIIKPDIFVLQFCDNDLVNNSYFLEGGRIVRNQKNLRPYWVDDHIRYRIPADSPYVLLYRASRLFRSLDALLTTLQFKMYKSYCPPRYQAYEGLVPAASPEQQALIREKRRESIAVTAYLMREMRRSLPAGTKAITFPASADDPEELRIWEALAADTGFTPYPSVAIEVEAAERDGKTVRVRDGAHWNRLGNKIAGEVLVRILERDFL